MDNNSIGLEKLRLVAVDITERFHRNQDAEMLKKSIDSVAIPRLNDAVSEAFRQIKDHHLYRPVEGEDSGHLKVVHYTSVDTIIKMLQDYDPETQKGGHLRLYDTFHSNDPDEGRYLTKFFSELIIPDEMQGLVEMMPDNKCAYTTSFVAPTKGPIDLVMDNLVFWQTYGLKGTGCSLTVDLPTNRLFKVEYGRKSAQSTVKKIQKALDEVLGALKPIIEIDADVPDYNICNLFKKELALAFREGVEAMLYLHKSEAYRYENEVRVLKTAPSIEMERGEITFQYKLGEPKIRHYCKDDALSANNLLATGSVITLGPCVPYKENMAYYLEWLKQESRLLGPKVVQSDISYRKG